MCRMLAAAGRLEPAALAEALRLMAANANLGHDHEYRALGEKHRHEDGWGAVWNEGGVLKRRREPGSCLDGERIERIAHLETDLLVLHARRASKGSMREMENTHPFLETYGERAWAFCHNGTIHDTSRLVPAPGLTPRGETDSERLFHHLLARLDPDDPVTSIRHALEPVRGFTALNGFLLTAKRVYAAAWAERGSKLAEFFTLWEGWGPGIHVVSSEPVPEIGCTTWWKVPERRVVVL